MAHFRFRWLVVVAAAMVVVVVVLVQTNGRGDSGITPSERNAEIVNLRKVTVSLGGGVTMEFVLIPAGTFRMGSPEAEKEREADEGPQHEVEITRAFYLGKYEVTQEQYQKSMGNNPSWFSATNRAVAGLDTRRFPVEVVSWNDATAFCRKLSERVGRHRFRLPTEAEWEYACRAGTTTPFHFGLSLNGDGANCDGTIPYGTEKKGRYLKRTCRVGSYAANAFGLHDIHGNVWEWCADWYDKDYYRKSAKKDPKGPESGKGRVVRGGCSCIDPRWCRSASRGAPALGSRGSSVGFRAVLCLD